jgi:hypothetical protein
MPLAPYEFELIWPDNLNAPLQFSYQNAVGPHLLTTRWQVTVPSGSVYQLSGWDFTVIRTAAPSAAEFASALLNLGSTNLVFPRLLSSTVGASAVKHGSGQLLLQPGITVAAFTTDGSTGGVCYYICNAVVHVITL